MAELIEKTYGQALFDLSLEEDKISAYADEMQIIKNAIAENPDLLVLLNHPQISRENKIEVMKNCLDGRASDSVTGFFVTVIQAGRQQYIPGMIDYFLDAVRKYQHIGVADVTSACALSDAQKAAVEKRLLETTDNVAYEIHYQVDPELIGGMVIRIGDKVADNSIRTRLNTLTKALL
jgi:F-type H+-transporting ATPase subunit delta